MKQHLDVLAATIFAMGVGGAAPIVAHPVDTQSVKAEKKTVKQDIKQDTTEAKAVGKSHKKAK